MLRSDYTAADIHWGCQLHSRNATVVHGRRYHCWLKGVLCVWEEVLTCIVASMSSHAQAWRASACETCCSRGASTAHYRHTSQLPYARIEMCSVKLSVTTSWW